MGGNHGADGCIEAEASSGALWGSSRVKPRTPILLWIVGVLIMAPLLTTCTTGALSIDVEVTLYAEEHWKIGIDLVYNRQEIQLIGKEIEKWLATSVVEWQAAEIKASHVQDVLDDGNVRYQIDASGQGFAKLNAAFFDSLAVITYDESVRPPLISFRYLPLGEFFSAALSRTFSLTGGEIMSSNGVKEANNTVAWVDPINVMDATLTPAPRLNLVTLGGGAGVVLILLAATVLVRRGAKTRCSGCGAKVSKHASYCPGCGLMMNGHKS